MNIQVGNKVWVDIDWAGGVYQFSMKANANWPIWIEKKFHEKFSDISYRIFHYKCSTPRWILTISPPQLDVPVSSLSLCEKSHNERHHGALFLYVSLCVLVDNVVVFKLVGSDHGCAVCAHLMDKIKAIYICFSGWPFRTARNFWWLRFWMFLHPAWAVGS